MWGKRTLGVLTVVLAVLAAGLVASAAPGDLDTSFSADGVVTTSVESGGLGQSVAVQSDGKVVVAGYALVGGNYDVAVVRYTSSGALDSTFGTGGIVTVD
ncbi:MAG: hypothetical protein HN361_07970, partial [Actinobacteria bacterium]|nr:hypothetical protein [Actinomycetota bacterium]